MDGLYEDRDNSLLFDKPSGRVVELYTYSDRLSGNDILAYYSETLPALGWQKLSARLYKRGREELKVKVEQGDTSTSVIFTLTPAENF